MSQINRLNGGLVERKTPLNFTFDNQSFQGYKGDTLASALLASGVRLVGRSFKYHRPRGIFTAGSEEPNALVELRRYARQEPNTRATVAELFDGLEAKSQNRWPSLKFDFLAINDKLSNFLGAGFYYKTFMWPASFWEKVYEPIIRRAAGLGNISFLEDPDHYDRGFLHCDVLVIGGGPAGLSAALTAGRAGARVILADEDFRLGGRLNSETFEIGELSASKYAQDAAAELDSMPNVRVMSRTSVVSSYDHGIYTAVERVSDHLPKTPQGKPRQIFWRIYSKRAIVCAGAIERPIAFENNDRPGIMLSSAVRAYANRWAVTPADTVAVFTNNDNGHRTAYDLIAKGVTVSAVIDTRSNAPKVDDAEVLAGAKVIDSKGRKGLSAVTVRLQNGQLRQIPCGALAVSGGWSANVAMTCHQNNRPVWNEELTSFVPGNNTSPGQSCAGAAKGDFSTAAALDGGAKQAISALDDLGIEAKSENLPTAEDAALNLSPFWYVGEGKGRAWIDQQNDVTVKDIEQSIQENFSASEHIKRYTTLGMATDQGKTGNVIGLAIAAELAGQTIPDTGSISFRPPYTPVALGAMAGRSVGIHYRPVRKTPFHKWNEENGAAFTEVGNWLRAQWYALPGETHWRQSVDREVLAVGNSVGIADVSTLGKIDVQGSGAAEFLNKIYTNAMAKLSVGKCRYGLMLREDGIAYDDGTVARLADDRFIVTTTTMNAALVYQNMQFVRQCLWPELDVQVQSITEAWGQIAIAGPNSRRLLEKIIDPGFNISNDAFPFMANSELTICDGLPARLFRISFSGHLAYELALPPRFCDSVMRILIELGEPLNAVPYGIEAMNVMRIEKGHATGAEINGQTTALSLGLGRMVNKTKDSIGNVLSERDVLSDPSGPMLVGLRQLEEKVSLVAGSHLVNLQEKTGEAESQGHVTSVAYSPNLESTIGLGFLKNGESRKGEIIWAVNPLQGEEVQVEVTNPVFVDTEGERLRV